MAELAETEIERLRVLALEVIAKGQELLSSLPGAPPASAPASEPMWMRIRPYAESRGFTYRTILEFVGEGMPSVGEGRRRRIVVREADRWVKTKGARPPARKQRSTPEEEDDGDEG